MTVIHVIGSGLLCASGSLQMGVLSVLQPAGHSRCSGIAADATAVHFIISVRESKERRDTDVRSGLAEWEIVLKNQRVDRVWVLDQPCHSLPAQRHTHPGLFQAWGGGGVHLFGRIYVSTAVFLISAPWSP